MSKDNLAELEALADGQSAGQGGVEGYHENGEGAGGSCYETGSKEKSEKPLAGLPRYGKPRINLEGYEGSKFKSFGDFLQTGMRDEITFKAQYGDAYDALKSDKVKSAAINTLKFEEGGALVLPEYAPDVISMMYESENLWSRTRQFTVGGNSMKFPKLRDTDHSDGRRHGGVVGYWTQECKDINESTVLFDEVGIELKKLAVIVCLTEEMINDSSYAIESFVGEVVRAEIDYQLDQSLICGSGKGCPLGILNSPGRAVVAPEEDQAPETILFENIVNMWACRATGGGPDGWVWIMCPETFAQLMCLSKAVGTAGGQLAFLPPGGLSASPYGTLLGAPIMISEHAQPLGCEGDIMLVSFREYLSISKGTINQFSSPHVHFYSDKQCLKFTFRVNGTPCYDKPIKWEKCNKERSHIIVLGARKAA